MGQFGAAFCYCSTAVSFLILDRVTEYSSMSPCQACSAQQSRADREMAGGLDGDLPSAHAVELAGLTGRPNRQTGRQGGLP